MKKSSVFKRIICFSFVLIILSAICSPVFAARTDKDRLVDNGALLSAQEQEKLINKLNTVSDHNSADVVVATVNDPDLSYNEMVAAADDFYDYNGYSDDGLVLLYNAAIDRTWISTKGKAIDAFEDEDIQNIGKQIKTLLTNGEYYTAFDKFADIADDEFQDHSRSQLIHLIVGIAICIVVGIVIAAIVARAIKSKYKPVRLKAEANDYLVAGSFKLHDSYDRFLYTHITKTRRSDDKGSGSSTHTSSSGSSHGGGGF